MTVVRHSWQILVCSECGEMDTDEAVCGFCESSEGVTLIEVVPASRLQEAEAAAEAEGDEVNRLGEIVREQKRRLQEATEALRTAVDALEKIATMPKSTGIVDTETAMRMVANDAIIAAAALDSLGEAQPQPDASGEMRTAVNDYLLAQNTAGYKDGKSWDGDTSCHDARRHLCETVYQLNQRACTRGEASGE